MIRKFLFILVLTFILAAPSYAAVGIDPRFYPEGAPTISGEAPTQDKKDGPETDVDKSRVYLTQRVVNFLFGMAGIVAIYFIVSNAWWLIASAGNEEKVTEHKKGLTWAIIGLVLVILSYSIIRFIISIPFQAHEPEKANIPDIKEGDFQLQEPELKPPGAESPSLGVGELQLDPEFAPAPGQAENFQLEESSFFSPPPPPPLGGDEASAPGAGEIQVNPSEAPA